MKAIMDLNATAEFCANRAGCCVFLDRDYAKCKLFGEELDYATFDEAPIGTAIKRCWACLVTFEEPEK